MRKINFAEAKTNLKKNWYFPISSLAFFCLTLDNTIGYCLGMVITFAIMLWFAAKTDCVWEYAKGGSTGGKILLALSTVGICLGNAQHFYDQTLKLGLPESFNILFLAVSLLGAAAALGFVYVCLSVFWKKLGQIAADSGMFRGIKTWEWILYGALLLAAAVLIVVSFSRSVGFYGADYLYDTYGVQYFYDIIYTSDSPEMIRDNAYLALTHPQNDLRQPLFAVFAAPFMGIPYLVGRILGTQMFQAMAMDIVQVAMLFAANILLTRMMKLSSGKRACFMVLASCTYTQLLFSLMMEQYIVAYFWLILCLYQICEKKKPDRMVLWGAGGTLLTSMVLLPFMSEKSPVKDFKAWFADMVKYGLEFVALMLVFCRLDVIFSLGTKVSEFTGYAGSNLTMLDKVYQYMEFIRGYFVAPDAGVNTTAVYHISWQLNTPTGINLIGAAILVLTFISVVLNRKQKSSLLAAGWAGFSVVMLLILGWGTKENGLILYALYFGWAFLVLLFQLVETIERKLNVSFLLPVLSICGAIALAAVNIPAIMEMVNFAVTYFPA